MVDNFSVRSSEQFSTLYPHHHFLFLDFFIFFPTTSPFTHSMYKYTHSFLLFRTAILIKLQYKNGGWKTISVRNWLLFSTADFQWIIAVSRSRHRIIEPDIFLNFSASQTTLFFPFYLRKIPLLLFLYVLFFAVYALLSFLLCKENDEETRNGHRCRIECVSSACVR